MKNSFRGVFHCRKTKAWFCFAREFNGLRHRIRRYIHVPQGSSDLVRASLQTAAPGAMPDDAPRSGSFAARAGPVSLLEKLRMRILSARGRLIPAFGRTTRWQVSWLTDQHLRPPSRSKLQWHSGRKFPVHSCGHSHGFPPCSQAAEADGTICWKLCPHRAGESISTSPCIGIPAVSCFGPSPPPNGDLICADVYAADSDGL